jgi:hypothetical protein
MISVGGCSPFRYFGGLPGSVRSRGSGWWPPWHLTSQTTHFVAVGRDLDELGCRAHRSAPRSRVAPARHRFPDSTHGPVTSRRVDVPVPKIASEWVGSARVRGVVRSRLARGRARLSAFSAKEVTAVMGDRGSVRWRSGRRWTLRLAWSAHRREVLVGPTGMSRDPGGGWIPCGASHPGPAKLERPPRRKIHAGGHRPRINVVACGRGASRAATRSSRSAA